GLVHAGPAFVGRTREQRKPLLSGPGLRANLGRMRRHERSLRKEPLPGAADVDQVVAVGAIAMQEHDELARGVTRARFEPRAVELSGHFASARDCRSSRLAAARPRAAWPRDSTSTTCRRRRRATAAMPRRAVPSPWRSVALRARTKAAPLPARRDRQPARRRHG